MALKLADLIIRLQSDVPQRGNVPTDTQYGLCIEDAVSDYSKRRPLLRNTSVDVVSGVDEYGLPDDFWQLVSMQTWEETRGVMVTPGGLIPMPADFTESWEVMGATLIIYPTPLYSWAGRQIKYLAAHVLDDDETYPYLGKQDAQAFMKRAQALALGLIANQMAGRVADWQVHDVKESGTSPLKEIRSQIEHLDKEYQAAVDAANRVRPILGHGYSQAELESWYGG
jgi:hypothetical protein